MVSSYSAMPFFCRKRANSASLSSGAPTCSASSFRLCQAPSFMVSKSFSLLTLFPLSRCGCLVYLRGAECLVAVDVELSSEFYSFIL